MKPFVKTISELTCVLNAELPFCSSFSAVKGDFFHTITARIAAAIRNPFFLYF